MKKSFFMSFCVCFMACVMVLLNVACFGDPAVSGTGDGASSQTSSSKFEIVGETNCTYDYNEYLGYTCEITGILKNNTSLSYSYVNIEFSVYDEDGNNLGTALDSVNNIGSGETWSFSATLLDFPSSRPASYRLKDITAF